jgi:hypothetical protein
MTEPTQYCESCKAKLIEEHRYINTEFDNWYECVEEDFTDEMRKVGIRVDKISFSGFCCQGDGAMFEGKVDDWELFFDAHKWDAPMTRKLLESGGALCFWTYHQGHYSHEYCANPGFEYDHFSTVLDGDGGGLMSKVIDTLDDELNNEIENFETECLDVFRSYMRDLYRSLEKEYDYLTDDEQVWDSILANDLYECDCEEEGEEYDEYQQAA